MGGGGNLVKDESTSVDVDKVLRRGLGQKEAMFLPKERIDG
jgi:hypothetical protein